MTRWIRSVRGPLSDIIEPTNLKTDLEVGWGGGGMIIPIFRNLTMIGLLVLMLDTGMAAMLLLCSMSL